MNQSTVNMVWVGNSISQIEALCMKSFIRCGMSVKLHAYNVIKGVPKEVEVCDANKIVLQKIYLNIWGVMQHFLICFDGN